LRQSFCFYCAVIWGFIVVMGIVIWFMPDYNDGFKISIKASFLEDIVFFLFIGFATVIISIINYEDEEFTTRVAVLANAVGNTSESINALVRNVRHHLVFSSCTNELVIIKDVYEENGKYFLKLGLENSSTYHNMCKDEPYDSELFNLTVEPGPKPDKERYYGAITKEVITQKGKSPATNVELIKFDKKEVYDRERTKLKIEQQSETTIYTEYWLWCYALGMENPELNSNDYLYYSKVSFTTSNFQMAIKNMSSFKIRVQARLLNRKDDILSVDNKKIGASVVLEKDKTFGLLLSEHKSDLMGDNIIETLVSGISLEQESRFELRFFLEKV
jgi:hypothetical protein